MHINTEETSDKIFKELLKKRVETGSPVGWFQFFENKKLVYEDHNIVVGLGREYLAQRTTSITAITSGTSGGGENLRDYDLTHYAFGAGGATADGITYTLLGPNVCDTNLEIPISFNINGFLDEPGGIIEGSEDIYTYEKSVKPIVYPPGNNTYETILRDYPTEDPTCSYYTQMIFTIYKEAGEFDLLGIGESVPVSEAGLYITDIGTGGTDAKLFARICFPPKFMELEAQYGIEWYVLA
jgi:hypothetical protein